MIYCDLKIDNNNFQIEGNVKELRTECVVLMREVYKKLSKKYKSQIATGIMFDILKQSIYDNKEIIIQEISDKEKLAYTE